jgi:hypothetical protein
VRTVQYFDKARMEVNHAVSDPQSQWAVTTGLLVVELVDGRVQVGPDTFTRLAPSDLPVAGDVSPGPSLDTAPRYSSFNAVASLPGAPGRESPPATGAEVLATIDRDGRVGALSPAEMPASVRYAAYSPETGHNIPDIFVSFMEAEGPVLQSGGLYQDKLFDAVYLLGYPITEAYWTTVPVAGKPTQVLVQLYQRRVLTYIPGFTEPWEVQMGNVGAHYQRWRYAQRPSPTATGPGTPVPTEPPAPPRADDTFVRVVGDRLFYRGEPVQLKGSNYWRQNAPFADTWIWWDGHQVYRELARARELGVNVIRIGIPYVPFGEGRASRLLWGERCGNGRPGDCTTLAGRIVNNMTQLLQLTSSYDIKVIFTLFEWSDSFPAPGETDYARQVGYLRGLVAPFASDDRVLGWDLHNEPDNYDTWKAGGSSRVIAWVANMAGVLREVDPVHPITVGVGGHATLWARDDKGRSLLDIVDLVSFHTYDAGALRSQITELEARTDKPILLEEMGWPTGPATLSNERASYDDATQLFLYKSMLADAKASSLVGVVQWMLYDYPPRYGGNLTPSYEPYFGLVRTNGSLKPAAAEFRDGYPTQFLPSRTRSDVPLTKHPGD